MEGLGDAKADLLENEIALLHQCLEAWKFFVRRPLVRELVVRRWTGIKMFLTRCTCQFNTFRLSYLVQESYSVIIEIFPGVMSCHVFGSQLRGLFGAGPAEATLRLGTLDVRDTHLRVYR